MTVGMVAGAMALAAAAVTASRSSLRDAIVAEPAGVQIGAPTKAADDAWFIAGSSPERYSKALEVDPSRASGRARMLRSVAPPQGSDEFGTLMQSFSATKFRGERIRFSAEVRTSDVTSWSGLWMRVDRNGESVAFDNMADRAIRETTSWERYHVVVDVPGDADAISLGVLVHGEGAAWVADPRVDIVSRDVPLTVPRPQPLPSEFTQ